MSLSALAVAWWKRDTALHSFVLVSFIITLPFTVFNTYVVYQLQIAGLLLGTDDDGLPCTTYCTVDWMGSRFDLNSVLLYMNAFGFGLGGLLTLFLSAYLDYWSRKHLIVTFFVVCYGALSIPVWWLRDFTMYNFQTLSALSILFAIIMVILIALLNIYIPYCMRSRAAEVESTDRDAAQVQVSNGREGFMRKYGFEMSVFSAIAVACSGILIFVVIIVLVRTMSPDDAQPSGLLMTTIIGFLTLLGSSAAYLGLPPIPAKPVGELKRSTLAPFKELFAPFRDLLQRKSMAVLLVSYTIYIDTTFAIASVAGQLFVLEVLPDTLEYTLYAMAQSVFSLIGLLAFLFLRPHVKIRLETWLLTGYALMAIIPIWGCIGFANVKFGFKSRWEFYVQQAILSVSQALVNSSFRVLFSEMVPAKSEVRWFGLSLILTCATIWVNYVASAPLQNATHNLRFPLVLSLIFMVVALALEACRVMLPVFRLDRERWIRHDEAVSVTSSEAEQTATMQRTVVETKV